MGPSGSGKTTFLRLLMGTLKPFSGSVSVEPEQKKTFLFQEDRLLSWETALRNVALSSDEAQARKWLKRLEITDVNQYPGELSGGMRRRVAIARALAFGGDMLLMDEPFKGLDEALKDRVSDVIRDSAQLIVMSTHDVKEAERMHAQILDLQDLL